MKNTTANPFLLKMMVLVTCFMLVILYNKSKASDAAARVAISFDHNPQRHELNVTVKANREANLQLFLFSADGVLVKEVPVTTLKKTIIRDLSRGYYMYECFNRDTRLKSGTLLIK